MTSTDTIILLIIIAILYYIGKFILWIVRKDLKLQKERARKVRVIRFGELRAKIKADRIAYKKDKMRQIRLENYANNG